MIVLGIETALPEVGVALHGDEGPIGSLQVAGGHRHAELLTPALDSLCRLCGVGLDQVSAVAVDVGPGLFTGLRVGVATAQALGFALGVPLVAVRSLDALAHPHRGCGRLVAAVVDARRGQVFRSVEGRLAPAAVDPADLAEELGTLGAVLAVGDGAVRYKDLWPAGVDVAPASESHPRAAVVAEMGLSGLVAGEAREPAEVQPEYLRGPDVRIGWLSRSPGPLEAAS
ncbi:MAG: tRNA (adenosine(37)-N6)-threonylcarbamoyltransferase complex dimerization subunit type 1 TsaB, partial [Acidimicrobiales bacterium]